MRTFLLMSVLCLACGDDSPCAEHLRQVGKRCVEVTADAGDSGILDASSAVDGGAGDGGTAIVDSGMDAGEGGAASACTSHAQCTSGQAPRCVDAQCSLCQASADCERFADTPVCGAEGACVACTAADPGACAELRQVCLSGGHACVACNVSTDCGDATKPICDGHACRGCTEDADCAGEGKVCREATGECVACEPNANDPTQENCANGKACDPVAFTCTGAARRTLSTCGQCISDSECILGARCVATSFNNALHGTYCLEQKDSGACPNRYAAKRSATSALGVTASYCFPNSTFTTCEGILSFKNLCDQDSDCGADGVDDGLCRDGACTYGCDGERDCSGPLSPPAPPNCIGVGVQYCNPN